MLGLSVGSVLKCTKIWFRPPRRWNFALSTICSPANIELHDITWQIYDIIYIYIIYHIQGVSKTLPEAQRTQGIESVTWMMFFNQNCFKLIPVRNVFQVVDSIPWVRCASGNVFKINHKNFQLFFFYFSQLFLNLFSIFSELLFNFFFYFNFLLH